MKNTVLVSIIGALASFNALSADLYYQTDAKFVNTKNGELLVGHEGLALYTFLKDDKMGVLPPKCTSKKDNAPLGSCLARWPAAIVTEAQLTEIVKSDPKFSGVYNNELGKLQLTYSDLPLYYWFKDTKEVNFTGSGVGKAWSLVVKGKAPTMFSGL